MRKGTGSVSSRKRSVAIEDVGARVELRRHPAARRLTLRVSRTQRAVIVTLPLLCDLDEAGSFPLQAYRLGARTLGQPARSGSLRPRRRHAACAASRTTSSSPTPAAPASWKCAKARVPGEKSSFPAPPNRRRSALQKWLVDEAKRDLDTARRVSRPSPRLAAEAHRHPRSIEPLGLVLDDARAVVFLAASPGAADNPRLRRRARGRASCGDEPRAPVLGARSQDIARVRNRAALAQDLRPRSASLRRHRRRRRLSRSGRLRTAELPPTPERHHALRTAARRGHFRLNGFIRRVSIDASSAFATKSSSMPLYGMGRGLGFLFWSRFLRRLWPGGGHS